MRVARGWLLGLLGTLTVVGSIWWLNPQSRSPQSSLSFPSTQSSVTNPAPAESSPAPESSETLAVSPGGQQSLVDSTLNDTSESDSTFHKGTATLPDVRPKMAEGFTGSNACGECHAELLASYQLHPMYYGATRPIETDQSPPASTGVIKGKTRILTARTDQNKIVHHEIMYDAQGELIYDDAHAMDYVIGSGRRAKAYIQHRGNLLLLSPLNWFGKTQQWNLNPGYTADDPRRFDRKATANCVLCHTGSINTSPHGADTYDTEPFGEMPIGCERCHGPGQQHISFHRTGSTGSDPIINPANLSQFESDSVCYQCHLQPSSSRILRKGRAHTDFRPGMRLDDVWLVIDSNQTVDETGRTDSVRQVQQMRESRCFQASGAMNCTSCHDPHSVPATSDVAEHFRNQCIKCHADASGSCNEIPELRSAAEDNCVTCHMPKRDLVLSVHSSQTDHRILRRPDQTSNPMKNEDEPIRFFDNHAAEVSGLAKRRAIALFQIGNGSVDEKLYGELADLAKQFPDDGQLWLALGAAAYIRGELPVAFQAWTRATEFATTQEHALEALANAAYRFQDWQNTLRFTQRLSEVNPYHANSQAIQADALLRLGFPDPAIAAAQKAVTLNPSLITAQRWLSEVYEQLGASEKARFHRKIAERMESAGPPK